MSGPVLITGEDSTTALPTAVKVTSNAVHVLVTPGGTQTVDTELPAAAALADAAANSTTPTVGTANLLYNGTTWDRVRGDTTNGMDVDVTRLPALVASEAHIGEVGGKLVPSAVTFARPADTTAYAAKDAVSNSTSAPTVLTFAGAGRVNAGTGYVTGMRLMTDQSTNVAQYRLHLYSIAPTAINDNAAQTLLWANRTKRVGYIDIGPLTTEGSGSDAASGLNVDIRLPYKCDTADTNLYGLLETLTAFTPASAQNFYLTLSLDLN
jgi:hypothetical protein